MGDSEQAILDAYYSGDFAGAARLCGALLHEDPQHTVAQTYLEKVRAAWEQGYGVPFELRRQLHQAQRLERLRDYDGARSLCESLLAEARALGIFGWTTVEETLLRLDRFEKAVGSWKQANACVQKDQWEEALEHSKQALSLAPELEHIRNLEQDIEAVLDEEQRFARAALPATSVADDELELLVQALEGAHTLRARWPTSARIQVLVAAIENVAARTRQEKIREIGAALEATASPTGLWVMEDKLRSASTLLGYVRRIPGEARPIEELSATLRLRQANLELAKTFEGKIVGWLLNKNVRAPTARIEPWMTPTQMVALASTMRQILVDLRQMEMLMAEMEFCWAAMACNSPQAIAHFADAAGPEQSAAASTAWHNAWKIVRGQILVVSKEVKQCLQNGAIFDDIMNGKSLTAIRELAEQQIFPLSQLAYTIAQNWSRSLNGSA